jgi:malonyl-CoA O-methyltransferase
MSRLEPREAYRLWAPSYEEGSAVTELDRRLVEHLGPSPEGLRLLDAGCGTGWRLVGTRAARAVGVDISPEMLARGRGNPGLAGVELRQGDLRSMPLPDRAFDLVWCRLAIGYLPDLERAFAELARVSDAGAAIVATEFHPAALAAGHRRTFRHGGCVHELLTYPHTAEAIIEAARRAGLELRGTAEAKVGPEVRRFYARAGRDELYRQQRGLPLVLGLRFSRDG